VNIYNYFVDIAYMYSYKQISIKKILPIKTQLEKTSPVAIDSPSRYSIKQCASLNHNENNTPPSEFINNLKERMNIYYNSPVSAALSSNT
jgi:hypothetical protein